MTTAPETTVPTTIATPKQTQATQAAAAPRLKLSSHGFRIDHPEPALGEQLMANALGVADRDAMEGMLRQLIKASANGGRADEVNLAFMISMVQSIRPRDSVEAMLVAQMVSVHVMAMRCAQHLANANDLAQHDSAARALGRLARTFPAQIEALNRYRSQGTREGPRSGEPAITVQNVNVEDGGNAIVGTITQHANVIVSDQTPPVAPRIAPKPARTRHRRDCAESPRDAQA
ncbi:hypothetical protein J6500_11460 [Bradyrhizobium sp. WSM 1704]|uniref:hypothetical protein n=1 Tax=Bradyrhizobium semiaridum TaxID=2821404 RepID=UPI001CE2F2FF|nr:hypothetical protein [Bradyrhizobium semiaridum]MCA6122503.1 hypothetical protein [Bradyrhizobium semiaridum]